MNFELYIGALSLGDFVKSVELPSESGWSGDTVTIKFNRKPRAAFWRDLQKIETKLTWVVPDNERERRKLPFYLCENGLKSISWANCRLNLTPQGLKAYHVKGLVSIGLDSVRRQMDDFFRQWVNRPIPIIAPLHYQARPAPLPVPQIEIDDTVQARINAYNAFGLPPYLLGQYIEGEGDDE